MDRRIALVTPPSPFLLDERVFVSLGILRVGAALEAAGYVVEHVDLAGIANFEDAVRDHALRSKAKAFGITATTPQMPSACLVARAIRSVRPDARIILGGPHVTLVHAARKLVEPMDDFDVIVTGDGERAVLEALETDAWLVDGDDPKGPHFLKNGEMPWPARHLVDMESYHYSIDGVRATSTINQLGCPFECAFCGGRASPMLRRIRTRTKEDIIAELLDLHGRYNLRGFMFYDDELNVNRELVPLMDAISALGLDLRLRGFVKAELFTDEQAAAMRRAGFRWILVGFESGSPRILENIRKKATREDNTRAVEIAHRNGLKVKALMSIGHAGESSETIEETCQWLLETKPDDFDCTIITVYPGTPYYDQAVDGTYTAKNGDRLHWRAVDFTREAEYYKGVPGEYQAFVSTDYLTSEEIVLARDALESEVRDKLGIPFNAGAPGVRYEASMGQLPGHVLRCTSDSSSPR